MMLPSWLRDRLPTDDQPTDGLSVAVIYDGTDQRVLVHDMTQEDAWLVADELVEVQP